MNTERYNQKDPRWGAKRLGNSGLTMATHGCYVTVTASILAATYKKLGFFGANLLTPGDLCDALNAQPDGFDGGGMLGWDALHRLFPDVFIYGRVWTTNAQINTTKVTVEKCVKDLRRAMLLGMTVGICVDLIGPDKIPDHIVALESMPDNLNDMVIMDPWVGGMMKFTDRYGDPLTGIMGYRLLIGNRPNPPHQPDTVISVESNFVNSMIVATWKASQVYQNIGLDTYKKEILDNIMGG